MEVATQIEQNCGENIYLLSESKKRADIILCCQASRRFSVRPCHACITLPINGYDRDHNLYRLARPRYFSHRSGLGQNDISKVINSTG